MTDTFEHRQSRLVCLAGVLCCCACGAEELAPATPPVPLPAREQTPATARGPYAVGVTTIEEVNDMEGAGRSFPVEIWYPATTVETDDHVAYELRIGALVLAEYPSPLGAVRDAPVDHHGSGHPVVVFSHGWGGTRLQSVYLTEFLASHGFIVAAPDHVGNTFAEELSGSNALSMLEAARVRPGDVSRTLDALLELNDSWPDSHLAYAVNPARVAVAGHSFGGFTTYRVAGGTIDSARADELCAANPGELLCNDWPPEKSFPASQKDERFTVALAQAPGGAVVFEDDGLSQIDVPIMIQAGRDDTSTSYASEAVVPFGELGAPAYLMSLEGGGHFTFSDMCLLIDLIGLTTESFDDGCSADNITTSEAHPLINAFALTFLRRHLLEQDADLHALLPTPEVTLESK